MNTRIFDYLYEHLIAIAQEMTGEKRDTRFKDWAKEITSVDRTATNGYAFEGDWISSGTVELELKPRIFLVAFTHGSRKYNVTEYAVVLMDGEGELHPTEIKTDSGSKGWALRIRDDVVDLLASCDSQGETPSPQDELMDILRDRFPEMDDDEIITAALNVYEMHTRKD